MPLTRDDALDLDAGDPLAGYRDEFYIPDDALIYLDGNSLGRPTKASRDRVRIVLDDDWGTNLIRSWEQRWVGLPNHIGDLIGRGLLGAAPGETIVGDTTTVALYKAVSAALDARPERSVIVIERDNFPTDRYVVESLAQQRNLTIRWIEERGPSGVAVDDVHGVLDETVGVVVLSHVDYRSAALVDMPTVTAAVHSAGAIILWDLCHSVGAVPLDLPRDGVGLAVGCTYKYLNGGPGAPAFTFVSSAMQAELRQPIWGWWSRSEMFEMEQGYRPEVGIRSWLTGTPGVLSMVGIEPAVELTVRVGMPAIRQKSMALTELAVSLYDESLAPLGCWLLSPRDPERRGSHIMLGHPDAASLTSRLVKAGILPDYRRPDGIRLGLAPLTTRFVDVYDGLERLAALIRA